MTKASGQDVVPSKGAGRALWGFLRRRKGVKSAAAEDARAETSDNEQVMPGQTPPRRGAARTEQVARTLAPPIQVLIGWVAEAARKDVLAHARGIAEDQLASIEQAWLAIAPYRGGFFYEVHEGGAGKAYLPEVIQQLDRDPDQILWMSAGTGINRVMTVGITDNIPYAVILTETESALVRQSGQEPIRRTGRMRRMVSNGQGVLISGALIAAMSLGVLGMSLHHARGLAQQPPMLVSYQPEVAPFRRIVDLTSVLPDDRWLVFVLYENGTWRSEYATTAPLILPQDDDGARMMATELRASEAETTDAPDPVPGQAEAEEAPAGQDPAAAAPAATLGGGGE